MKLTGRCACKTFDASKDLKHHPEKSIANIHTCSREHFLRRNSKVFLWHYSLRIFHKTVHDFKISHHRTMSTIIKLILINRNNGFVKSRNVQDAKSAIAEW